MWRRYVLVFLRVSGEGAAGWELAMLVGWGSFGWGEGFVSGGGMGTCIGGEMGG